MLRTIAGIILGVVAWYAVVFIASFALRTAAPHLGAALVVHATTTALAARLGISFLASLLGGWLAATVARSQRAPLIAGVLMLAIFVPYHLYGRDPGGTIWTSYPLWYHLTFFVSLVLLSVLGGRLARGR
jgi:hypothetical protein